MTIPGSSSVPYSTDLSPIELAWSKAKALLRKAAARIPRILLRAVTRALRAIASQDAIGWSQHCSYRTTFNCRALQSVCQLAALATAVPHWGERPRSLDQRGILRTEGAPVACLVATNGSPGGKPFVALVRCPQDRAHNQKTPVLAQPERIRRRIVRLRPWRGVEFCGESRRQGTSRPSSHHQQQCAEAGTQREARAGTGCYAARTTP
jgi:hypothetical protein